MIIRHMACVLAAAVGFISHASAKPVTLTPTSDDWFHVFPHKPSYPMGVGPEPLSLRIPPYLRVGMNFSDDFIGLSYAFGMASAPATAGVRVNQQYDTLAFDMPAVSLSGDATFGPDTLSPDARESIQFTPTGFSGQGGITFTTPRRNFATTGGNITLENVRVDLTSMSVHADVQGGNGVGAIDDLLIWHIESPPSLQLDWQRGWRGPLTCWDQPLCGPVEAQIQMYATGLSLDVGAVDVFTQALGLTNSGKTALLSIENFGTIGISPVPESSTLMMMGIGLVGLLGLRAQRRSTR